jgi:hypothetical protein
MAWPGSWPEDPMSPTSFYDDGASIEDRLPPKAVSSPSPAVNVWTSNAHNSEPNDPPSTYNGSYFDDGADMLPRRAPGPGFGAIDPHFYTEDSRKRREREKTVPFHPLVQCAASGYINRTMREIKSMRDLRDPEWYIHKMKPWSWEKEAKEAEEVRDTEELKKKKREPIRVWAFNGWPDFIVHSNDGSGRVIVVTDDGEFDSGPMPHPLSLKLDPRALFEAELKQQQQRQPSTAKRRNRHVNFKDDEVANDNAKNDKSMITAASPPALPLMRQERKARAQKEKERVAEREEQQLTTNLQDAWMSGGRSGWPQSNTPLNNPEDTWGRQHTLPTPQEAWVSGGLDAWHSITKSLNPPASSSPFKDKHGKQLLILSSSLLILMRLDAWSTAADRRPSLVSSEDSWTADMEAMVKGDGDPSNYHSPTVEDAPETPMEKPRYMNGYDNDENTYLNARRGGVRYREYPQWG